MLAAGPRAPSEALGAHLNKPAASIRWVWEMGFVPGRSLQCLFVARASARAGPLVGKGDLLSRIGMQQWKRNAEPAVRAGMLHRAQPPPLQQSVPALSERI